MTPLSTCLGGRYTLERQLGQGGFGQTFLARDEHLPDKPLRVVKSLRPKSSDPYVLTIARRLFDAEARTLYLLGTHDRIPQLHAHFEEGGEFFLVQDYVAGRDLSRELIRGQRWTPSQVVSLLRDVLEILDFVHHHQVIHRDIKPANLIRRDQDGRIVLIDFGAVKQITTQINPADAASAFTVAIGTPGYAPGEQAQGKPRTNSDLYALGMVAIEALTGIAPQDLDTDPASGEPLWQVKAPQVPGELGAILNRMVALHPGQRYQQAAEVLADLDRLPTWNATENLATEVMSVDNSGPQVASALPTSGSVGVPPIPSATDGLTPPTGKPAAVHRPRPWKAVAAGLGGVLLLSAASFAWVNHRQYQEQQTALTGVQALQSKKAYGTCQKEAQALSLKSRGEAIAQQARQLQVDCALAEVQALAAAGRHQTCLELASGLTFTEPAATSRLQSLTQRCRLGQAKQLADQKTWPAAIALAKTVPTDSPLYGEAQSLIATWIKAQQPPPAPRPAAPVAASPPRITAASAPRPTTPVTRPAAAPVPQSRPAAPTATSTSNQSRPTSTAPVPPEVILRPVVETLQQRLQNPTRASSGSKPSGERERASRRDDNRDNKRKASKKSRDDDD
ncbi:MAG: protein kinase [Gloeomargaritaceae cyanobacterium C42_A2020_066]|nr:protein kinase [Gloeomargaritaceae cyanobacterium C42_A2020_066]